jgi:2-polyprenyl-3-methyl-5-hydroxy-6-metoxy-1,4-benzoquinol methylase
VKAFLKKLFPSVISLRNRVYNFKAHYRFRGKHAEEVFETIYKENHWNDQESKSGTGSNKKNTKEVVGILSKAIAELQIKSMLDIPCGDFNWMKNVDLKGVTYLGADIVEDLVAQNQKKGEPNNINFKKLNILTSSLPTVDLIFSRDCLVHFSYEDISKAKESIKKSNSKYWMITTFPKHKNYDIITGDWRPINLQAAPFSFPEPLALYNEQTEEDARYEDKSLAIWRVSDL